MYLGSVQIEYSYLLEIRRSYVSKRENSHLGTISTFYFHLAFFSLRLLSDLLPSDFSMAKSSLERAELVVDLSTHCLRYLQSVINGSIKLEESIKCTHT